MAFDYSELHSKLQARGYIEADKPLDSEMTDSTIRYTIDFRRATFNNAHVPGGVAFYEVVAGISLLSDDRDGRNILLETTLDNILADLRALDLYPESVLRMPVNAEYEGTVYDMDAIVVVFREAQRVL